MLSQLRTALVLFLLFTVITGVLYPALITLIAQGVFPHQANGSVIVQGDKVVGSELIGQHFDERKYFWSRPSATSSSTFEYDASSSTGSNLGPTNPDLHKAIEERVAALRQAHPDQTGPIPVDLVTASASGLDPHISRAAADYQAKRVADSRGMTLNQVRDLIAAHTEGRSFGVLGEPRVNVLKLNLTLDGK
jgi:K+-transporting ATPase ATPase C chain